ncbi:hypothetical protein GCM10010329_38160 [Streptomyces spiroverticillatus]|uniref:Thioesterase family protein n=1 Tax=Streptomyces finlayi TaxID=67296 RepID=A0A918WY51_9ACTN|nr:hypothetical protein [Streptomyces finlayi]GHA11629.1 hypothetical protein GCM10010329_38160 [Streptomyces spiroverticillatus]GHC94927.1 hypothetical protein GCM10010334_33450 [Streptomyces finlayi]
MPSSVSIGRRHNGPPDSANGGYACGLFAAAARPALPPSGAGPLDVAVQLLAPPPLDTALRSVVTGRRVTFWHDDTLVASAAAGRVPDAPIASVDLAAARTAEQGYAGRESHPYGTCYVCGPDHRDRGLALAPGPVSGRPDTAACTWTPTAEHADEHGFVKPELIWAVLDCPGGWTLDPVSSPLVLGRMTARVHARPRVGETTVIVARGTPGRGRTAPCETAIFRPDGTELARSSAVWVRRDEKALS